MAKLKNKLMKKKHRNTCQYCGKLGSCTNLIHESCAADYLIDSGFFVFKYGFFGGFR